VEEQKGKGPECRVECEKEEGKGPANGAWKDGQHEEEPMGPLGLLVDVEIGIDPVLTLLQIAAGPA
jgi:hypothetical protein